VALDYCYTCYWNRRRRQLVSDDLAIHHAKQLPCCRQIGCRNGIHWPRLLRNKGGLRPAVIADTSRRPICRIELGLLLGFWSEQPYSGALMSEPSQTPSGGQVDNPQTPNPTQDGGTHSPIREKSEQQNCCAHGGAFKSLLCRLWHRLDRVWCRQEHGRARQGECTPDPAWSKNLVCADPPCAGTGRSHGWPTATVRVLHWSVSGRRGAVADDARP